MTVRELREVALRLDADRVVSLLHPGGGRARRHRRLADAAAARADRDRRPVGGRRQVYRRRKSAQRVRHPGSAPGDARPDAPGRPVQLMCAPGEAHVLSLHALAAAPAGRSVPSRLLRAATPARATMAAARRLLGRRTTWTIDGNTGSPRSPAAPAGW